MIRTHDAGTLTAADEGALVTLAGWVARRRDHGGVAFIDLREASGVVQVVVRDEAVAHQLRNEYCLKVTGTVSTRPEGNQNANLPTGEVEVIGADVGGMAVHIGARIGALGGPGEVLASSTVKDLVVGSGIEFAERGSHSLKGVPGEWKLFAVDSV